MTRIPRIAVALMGALLATPGCSDPARTRAASQPTARQTIERLIELYRARQFERMHPLIVGTHARQVVDYLLAMDEFLTANRQVCGFVRTHIGAGVAQNIDQSHMAGHMGVFSPYSRLLDELIEGDAASVSFVVDEQLPARRAQLRRVDGRWLYDPGPGDPSAIVPAVRRMADGLRGVLRELQNGSLDPASVRADPQILIEAVRVRLLPGVQMLPPPPASPGG